MLQSVKSLYGFRVGATDGLAGGVVDFYFNDQDWSLSQIVSSEHPTRLQKSVLIEPVSVRKVDASESVLHVNLSKAQIATLPLATTIVPVCRQYEMRIGARPSLKNADPHLRSATAVTGYEINDSEQHIGIVHDFLIDTKTWTIAFLVGRRFGVRERDFLVATSSVGQISFASRRVGIAKSSHWDLVFEERNGYDRLLNLEAA